MLGRKMWAVRKETLLGYDVVTHILASEEGSRIFPPKLMPVLGRGPYPCLKQNGVSFFHQTRTSCSSLSKDRNTPLPTAYRYNLHHDYGYPVQ